jgi:hypothetical protein
MSAAQVAEP